MKKKFLILITLFFSVLLLIFSVGCAKNYATVTGPTEQIDATKTLICDFESWEELVRCNYQHSFGKVEISEEHVTHGAKSAKFSVSGKYNTVKKPEMAIYTFSDYVKKTDYSDVKTFEIDAYNEMDRTLSVGLQIVTKQMDDSGQVRYFRSAVYYNEIQAKTEKHLVWNFDRDFLSKFIDISSVYQINLIFENSQAENGYEVLYLDNLYVTLTKGPIQDIAVRKDHEIESADKAEYLAAWYDALPLHSPSSLTWNNDPTFVKGGEGSIKCETRGVANRRMYPSLYLANAIPDLSKYYSISFWVYNDNDYSMQVAVNSKVVCMAEPKQWTYVEMTQDLMKKMTENNEPVDLTNVKRFLIGSATDVGKSSTFYIDEFYANIDTRAPEIVASAFEDCAFGNSIEIKEAKVLRADGATVQVFDPDGEEITVKEGSFTPEKRGEYTVKYTATNDYGTAEAVATFKVGLPRFKLEKTLISSTKAFTFVVETPVVEDANATDVSWILFDESGNSVGPERANSYLIQDGNHYLIYTAMNAYGSSTCRFDIYCNAGFVMAEELVSNFYDQMSPFLQCSVERGKDFVRFGEKSIKIQAKGYSYLKMFPLYLGTSLSSNEWLMFEAYNAGEDEIRFAYGSGALNLKHGYNTIKVRLDWLKAWGCVTEEDGAYLINPDKFMLSVLDIGTVYLSGFRLSDTVKTTYKIVLKDYQERVYGEIGVAVEYVLPACYNYEYSVNVFENETPVAVNPSKQSIMVEVGKTYTIKYSAPSYDGKTVEKTVTLTVLITQNKQDDNDKPFDEVFA